MSLADLRKELREVRKSVVRPVSKMKKGDCIAELERMKLTHKKEEKVEKMEHKVEEKAVKKVMKEAPKEVAKKVAEVQKKEHKKQEESTKKMHKEVPKEREDMSEKMARLRAMKKSKKDE